jgi:hypothetical protein
MVAVSLFVSLSVIAIGGTAKADTGPVVCDTADPSCDINVDQPGTGEPGDGGGSTGNRVCKDKHDDHIVPCWRDDLGWYGYDGCYYDDTKMSDGDLEVIGEKPRDKPGVWYNKNCFIDPTEVMADYSLVYLNQPPAPVVRLVALHATSRLVLPKLTTQASPAGAQLVRLPSWWWTAPASWRVESATASVPGISVTATATPYKAVWNAGDGSNTVTCAGPGTVWKPGGDPMAASPTCGHTYQRSSASAAGGAFSLTATVHWRITWTGGGTNGTEPDLRTTTTTPVRVAESQTVITR